jgi:hypothetical protein
VSRYPCAMPHRAQDRPILKFWVPVDKSPARSTCDKRRHGSVHSCAEKTIAASAMQIKSAHFWPLRLDPAIIEPSPIAQSTNRPLPMGSESPSRHNQGRPQRIPPLRRTMKAPDVDP